MDAAVRVRHWLRGGPVLPLTCHCVNSTALLVTRVIRALTGVQQDAIAHRADVIRGDKAIAAQSIGDTIDGIGTKRDWIILCGGGRYTPI